jgi:hypothetical protein
MSRAKRASFIVRVVWDGRGGVRGIIERVATGAKEAFRGVDAIGAVIARMVEHEAAIPRGGRSTVPGEKPCPRRRRPTRG